MRQAASSVVAGAVLALAGVPALQGQDWHTLESSRQLRSTEPASVRVEYAAGTIDLAPSASAVLYRMSLKYDAEQSSPIALFDEAARSVTIGTRSATSHWNGGHREGNTLRAELSRTVPLRLSLELGAAKGTLQLGGLRLQDLSLKTGATRMRIDFAEANPEALRNFDLDVGAADVTVTRAGNARAAQTRINVGVGSLDYDMAGAWEGETELSVNLALGNLTLRIPQDAGVRIAAQTFLVDFEKAGLEKRGSAWYSPGYDNARRRVSAHVSAAFGNLELIRR
jgi:hypothetical protein